MTYNRNGGKAHASKIFRIPLNFAEILSQLLSKENSGSEFADSLFRQEFHEGIESTFGISFFWFSVPKESFEGNS